MDFISSVYRYQYGTDFCGCPESNEPRRNVGCPHGNMVSCLYPHGNKCRRTFVNIATELCISSCIIKGGILKCILVGVLLRHCIKHIGESRINYIILFPYKCTCFAAVVVCLVKFFLFSGKASNIIGKVSKHYIGIIHFLIPCYTDIPLIIKRRKGIYKACDRKFSLTDENCFSVLHVPHSCIFYICTKALNSGFCTLPCFKVGFTHIP